MEMQRYISAFDKESEKMIQEINIDFIPFQALKEIFNPKDDDPLMYDPYSINRNESILLNQYMNPHVGFDFDKYIYQLDCFKR